MFDPTNEQTENNVYPSCANKLCGKPLKPDYAVCPFCGTPRAPEPRLISETPPPTQKTEWISTSALAFGIFSIVFACCPLLGLASSALGIFSGYSGLSAGGNMVKAGYYVSIAGAALNLATLLIGMFVIFSPH